MSIKNLSVDLNKKEIQTKEFGRITVLFTPFWIRWIFWKPIQFFDDVHSGMKISYRVFRSKAYAVSIDAITQSREGDYESPK